MSCLPRKDDRNVSADTHFEECGLKLSYLHTAIAALHLSHLNKMAFFICLKSVYYKCFM
ncbi:hypothetical protein BaLi_c20130 [Bacillus paralicheniformis ATCC 9945a]|nr:hypothetical protein BaLi_c20130 [Bacillus paralicheniformis ATCC 9945a]